MCPRTGTDRGNLECEPGGGDLDGHVAEDSVARDAWRVVDEAVGAETPARYDTSQGLGGAVVGVVAFVLGFLVGVGGQRRSGRGDLRNARDSLEEGPECARPE